uniref:Uncharacterized protein n=1 Tax=Arundo donax TaxID=35708 RepID=A0A0A8ZCW1_ARUDO
MHEASLSLDWIETNELAPYSLVVD